MQACGGVGGVALSHLLGQDGLLAASSSAGGVVLPGRTHHQPRAKNIIYIYLEGGPSQMDLYDPKPMLNQLDGQSLPESMLKNMRFAFLAKESADLDVRLGLARTRALRMGYRNMFEK